MKHKVLAYVVRRRADGWQLLVFQHENLPEAGLQVPAGSVEDGETIGAALWRELSEEAGLAADVPLAGAQGGWLSLALEALGADH